MKHLVVVLAVFLLMGSQTLAQETIPEPENLEDLKGFVLVNKPVVCGPEKDIHEKLQEFNEKPIAGWVDPGAQTSVLFYMNKNTGTTTVIEKKGPFICIISQGISAILPENAEKNKGLPIRDLTY